MISGRIEDREIQDGLDRLEHQGTQLLPAMRSIGEIMLSSIEEFQSTRPQRARLYKYNSLISNVLMRHFREPGAIAEKVARRKPGISKNVLHINALEAARTRRGYRARLRFAQAAI